MIGHIGCKKTLLHVTVKPYIFFSTPAPVDEEKADHLTGKQSIKIGYGGVLVNFCCLILSGIIIYFVPMKNEYVLLTIWQFMTLHFSEIVSYLFIGDLYLVSDMANIAEVCPKLRWVNLGLDCILTVIYGFTCILESSSKSGC